MTNDDIRAINQAAAHLDGVLYLSPDEAHAIAIRLFALAGNPMPDTPLDSAPSAEDSTPSGNSET